MKSQQFKIEQNKTAFSILSEKLYRNPNRAIVRELISNAEDSYGSEGGDVFIHLLKRNDNDYTLSFTDNGVGMSKEFICNNYSTYFSSEKSDDMDGHNGSFGIGSKSPFSYTRKFNVKSTHDGVTTNGECSMTDDGIPTIQILSSVVTNKDSGTVVYFDIPNNYDANVFVREIEKTIFRCNKGNVLYKGDIELLYEYKNASFKKISNNIIININEDSYNYGGVRLIQNNTDILFDIRDYDYEEDDAFYKSFVSLMRCDFTVRLPKNFIGLSPSRETIVNSKENISAIMQYVIAEFKDAFYNICNMVYKNEYVDRLLYLLDGSYRKSIFHSTNYQYNNMNNVYTIKFKDLMSCIDNTITQHHSCLVYENGINRNCHLDKPPIYKMLLQYNYLVIVDDVYKHKPFNSYLKSKISNLASINRLKIIVVDVESELISLTENNMNMSEFLSKYQIVKNRVTIPKTKMMSFCRGELVSIDLDKYEDMFKNNERVYAFGYNKKKEMEITITDILSDFSTLYAQGLYKLMENNKFVFFNERFIKGVDERITIVDISKLHERLLTNTTNLGEVMDNLDIYAKSRFLKETYTIGSGMSQDFESLYRLSSNVKLFSPSLQERIKYVINTRKDKINSTLSYYSFDSPQMIAYADKIYKQKFMKEQKLIIRYISKHVFEIHVVRHLTSGGVLYDTNILKTMVQAVCANKKVKDAFCEIYSTQNA